jgi:hypothetical protein
VDGDAVGRPQLTECVSHRFVGRRGLQGGVGDDRLHVVAVDAQSRYRSTVSGTA